MLKSSVRNSIVLVRYRILESTSGCDLEQSTGMLLLLDRSYVRGAVPHLKVATIQRVYEPKRAVDTRVIQD